MASETFQLKVFTPAGLELETQVQEVLLPSSNGEIGVLPHHAKYIGLLGTGILEYLDAAGKSRRIVVSGGFCNFVNEQLVILADSVDQAESVNRETYAQDRPALSKMVLEMSGDDPKVVYARQALARMDAIDHLLGQSSGGRH
jgi:F-type H+-transporting ATPase subunit epsilon